MRIKGSTIGLGMLVLLFSTSCGDMGERMVAEEKIISGDERWSTDVRVQKAVKVQSGATLTIEAGVIVTFEESGSLIVGNDGVANIIIDGTASKPVRMVGGRGVQILKAGSASRISNCITDGVGHSDGNAISILGLNFPIEALRIEGGGGLEVKGHLLGGKINGLYIDCANPVAMSVPADYREFITNEQLNSKQIRLLNGGNSLKVALDGGSSYLVTDLIKLEGEVKLSQAQMYFTRDAGLLVGGGQQRTTAEFKNSTFRLSGDGRWRGIVFDSQVQPASRVIGCEISGAEKGISIYTDVTFTIEGCNFHDNGTSIILIGGTNWNNNDIANNNTIPGGVGGIKLAAKGGQDGIIPWIKR